MRLIRFRRGRGLCIRSKILTEGAVQRIAYFPQPFHIRVCKAAALIRRDIEQKGRVRSHGVVINLQQFFQGTHLPILVFMIKPARTNRGIHFRREPNELLCASDCLTAAEVTVRRVFFCKIRVVLLLGIRRDAFHVHQRGGHNAPFGFAALTRFIAAPAYIRPAHANDRLRLQLADERVIALPVIHLLFAVRPLTTRAVEPHAEQLTVVRQQFT